MAKNEDGPEARLLRRVHVPAEDDSLVLAIRRVVAEWCGIPPDQLNAEVHTSDLHERMKSGWARGWDEAFFLMKLEEELHATLDMKMRLPPFLQRRCFFWSSRGPQNFGEWVREAVIVLRERIGAPREGQ